MSKKKLIRNWHRKKEILIVNSIIILVSLSIIAVNADVNIMPNNGIDTTSQGINLGIKMGYNIPSNYTDIISNYNIYINPVPIPTPTMPTLTKRNQTITFGALSDKTYGDAPFDISATASSGLSVSFSIVSGLATVSGSKITVTGTGIVTVRASQAGNYAYNAAPNVDQKFTVKKATPTITWSNPADIIYGTALSGTQLDATASVTGTFVYTPPAGTVLNVGAGQKLHVDFTPTDTVNYNSASKDVTINVNTVPVTNPTPPVTNPTPTEILAKIQPLLIPANRINPNTPLYDSQDKTGQIYIYKLPGTNPVVLVFQSSGAIDCDGQKTTLCNINTDPWYQSETSFTQSDGKYLNAATLPWYVLPAAGSSYFDYTKNNIGGGQLGLVMYDNNMNYGVFGDENGDRQSIGEISYAMASSLGINPDPHYGGVSCCGVTFIVFTGSGNIVSPIESHDQAVTIGNTAMNKLWTQLGG